MVTTDDFAKAVGLIEGSTDVLITAHTRPDGDACGSVRAMCDLLESLGKKVRPMFLSPLPQWYEFLFAGKVPVLGNDITTGQLNGGLFDDCDLVIIIDTNSYVQLPQFDEWIRNTHKKVLVIDHHVTTDNLGDVELIDTTAAAAGEIVLDLFKYAGWPITGEIAEALFVALSTDSGWFKFSNADSRVFRNAAEMLQNLRLHFDGRVAVQHIMRSDFDDTGATGRDTENLIDECQRIGSVEVALLFVELSDGGFRCSLRSKGGVDVRRIAQKFGGGGHTMASGVNLPGPLEHAKELIISEVAAQLNTSA